MRSNCITLISTSRGWARWSVPRRQNGSWTTGLFWSHSAATISWTTITWCHTRLARGSLLCLIMSATSSRSTRKSSPYVHFQRFLFHFNSNKNGNNNTIIFVINIDKYLKSSSVPIPIQYWIWYKSNIRLIFLY